MDAVVQLFDLHGGLLTEVETVTTREWRLNDPGDCNFVFPRGPMLQDEMILPGGFVLITSNYTSPWVGQIVPTREWRYEGPVVKAREAIAVLENFEILEINPETDTLMPPVIAKGTVSSLLSEIVEMANDLEDTRLRIGNLYAGGAARQEKLDGNLLDHVRFIVNRARYDFDVTPVVTNGVLINYLNLYEDKGIDTTSDFTLEEGVNLELAPDQGLIEQGRIVNRVYGIGEGVNDESRIAYMYENEASQAKYGLRIYSESFFGVTELETLETNTERFVSRNRAWKKTIRAVVNDTALFKSLEPGNKVHVVLHSFGFLENSVIGTDVTSRILSAELDDGRATMSILLEDVF